MALIGALLAVAAAMLLYLASPNQPLLPALRPRAALGWGGLALLIASVVVLRQWAGPATAVFIALTAAMLVWAVVPLAAAWQRGPKEDKR